MFPPGYRGYPPPSRFPSLPTRPSPSLASIPPRLLVFLLRELVTSRNYTYTVTYLKIKRNESPFHLFEEEMQRYGDLGRFKNDLVSFEKRKGATSNVLKNSYVKIQSWSENWSDCIDRCSCFCESAPQRRGITATEWQRKEGPRKRAGINHFQARVLLISIIV